VEPGALRRLDFGLARALECVGNGHSLNKRITTIPEETAVDAAHRCGGAERGRKGRYQMTALIVGLASIAAIWLVVIYGSIYVNKNVQ
jgi:hypothetical protein